MNLFSKVKQGMLESTKAIKDISSDVTEMTKLKVALSKDKASIDERYYELGKKLYESYKENKAADFVTDDVLSSLMDIDTTLKRIQIYETQIESLRGIIKCDQCGFVVDEDAKFCANCGNKLDNPILQDPVGNENPAVDDQGQEDILEESTEVQEEVPEEAVPLEEEKPE